MVPGASLSRKSLALSAAFLVVFRSCHFIALQIFLRHPRYFRHSPTARSNSLCVNPPQDWGPPLSCYVRYPPLSERVSLRPSHHFAAALTVRFAAHSRRDPIAHSLSHSSACRPPIASQVSCVPGSSSPHFSSGLNKPDALSGFISHETSPGRVGYLSNNASARAALLFG